MAALAASPRTLRLGLGTAQFGLAYGIANAGKTPRAEVSGALEEAVRCGFALLDTAPAYGDAEELLGELGAASNLRVVTKTPAAGDAPIASALDASLARLRAPKAYALLEHRPALLLGAQGARRFTELARLRGEGRVEKIGAAVYTRAEIDALQGRFALDVIQLPLSILDQRLLRDGTLARLKERGVEVHARSLLLQGALALDTRALPRFLAPLAPALVRIEVEAQRRELTRLALAIAFVASLREVDFAIVGAASRAQVAEIAAAARVQVTPGELAGLAVDDAQLLDPSRWPAR
jgi:aryl-alcohol dehydrogenase-like predicted oxidoreductase